MDIHNTGAGKRSCQKIIKLFRIIQYKPLAHAAVGEILLNSILQMANSRHHQRASVQEHRLLQCRAEGSRMQHLATQQSRLTELDYAMTRHRCLLSCRITCITHFSKGVTVACCTVHALLTQSQQMYGVQLNIQTFPNVSSGLHLFPAQMCVFFSWEQSSLPALLDIPTMLFFCFQKLMSFLNARKSKRSWKSKYNIIFSFSNTQVWQACQDLYFKCFFLYFRMFLFSLPCTFYVLVGKLHFNQIQYVWSGAVFTCCYVKFPKSECKQ